MVLKASFVVLAVLAASSVAAGGPLRNAGRAQDVILPPDAIILSSAERAEVLKGKIVLRAVANPGLKGRTYEAIGMLPGTIEEVQAVIIDYGHYPEFMPRVERIAVTDEGPLVSLVDQTLKLPLGARRQCRLRYSACPTAAGLRVSWVQVPWPEVPPSQSITETSGYWLISPISGCGLVALYHVYAEPGHVPLGLSGLALSLSKHDLPKVIEAVRKRLRPAPQPPGIKD